MSLPIAGLFIASLVSAANNQDSHKYSHDIGLRGGAAYVKHESFRSFRSVALIHRDNDFSTEITYAQEIEKRRREDNFSLLGIEIPGERTSERRLLGVNFGYALKGISVESEAFRLVPSVNVSGGFDLDVSEIEIESNEKKDILPRDIDVAFYVGLGLRGMAAYRMSHLTDVPFLQSLEAGVGLAAEYRRNDISSGNLNENNGCGFEGFIFLSYSGSE